MRVALAIILLSLSGCAELDPTFSTSQWFDGVEENRPTSQGLHTGPASANPGEWAVSGAQTRSGESAWHFGDGVGYPALSNASLLTPEFEAGVASFLRFSYFSDIQPLSDSAKTATDGAVVEAQVGDGEWVTLEPHGGYTHTIDQVVLGSPLSLGGGVFSGNDREWHDDYVELTDAEPGDAIRFRFRFGCDIDGSNNMGEGFYVDDVEFLIVE